MRPTTMIRRVTTVVIAAALAACGGGGGGDDGGSSVPVEVLDQVFETSSIDNFASCDSGYCPAQTFTVGITGELTGFDLFLHRIAATGSVTVDVRLTVGGVPVTDDGAALESFTFDASALGTTSAFIHFQLATPLLVTAGDVLALTMRDTVFGSGQLVGWNGEAIPGPYAQGAQFGRAGAYTEPWVAEFGGDGDLCFRTYVLPD